jgi:hypothetical protein
VLSAGVSSPLWGNYNQDFLLGGPNMVCLCYFWDMRLATLWNTTLSKHGTTQYDLGQNSNGEFVFQCKVDENVQRFVCR